MKFKHKILIDFKTFIKTTKFDCLVLGQTKEWITYNFPDPDHVSRAGKVSHFGDIFSFGNIELFFNPSDILWCIFIERFQPNGLDGGDTLEISPWIFDKPEKLTLNFVLNTLNNEDIDYRKETKRFTASDDFNILVTLDNGIELIFDCNLDYSLPIGLFLLEVVQFSDTSLNK